MSRGVWPGIAACAGLVVLAFVGAPLSVDAMMWGGVDRPEHIEFQLGVVVAGALGMALATAAAAWWRWVVVAGVIGVAIVLAISPPPGGGLTVSVADTSSVDWRFHPAWAAVLAASSGVLFIGVLGALRGFVQARSRNVALVGVAACAAYFGVSLTGALRSTDPVVQSWIVAVVAVVVTVAAVLSDGEADPRSDVGRVRRSGAVVLLTAVPTVVVALVGEPIMGTYPGGLVGVLIVVVALVVARRDRIVVGALGLVLAAPFTLLVLFHSIVAGEVWYAWPIAAAGVAAGAWAGTVVPRMTPLIVAAAVVPTAVLAVGGVDGPIGLVVAWIFLVLILAALAGSATAGAAVSADLPSLGALVVTAAVGYGHLLAFARIPESSDAAERAFGPGSQVAGVVALVVASVLLHLGVRGRQVTATVGGM